ncbi:MAG: M24 family metallopeptidase [Candidatus Lokiarchaeota archaeon]|nr:M24 family metallopeptidase [Candidatus Lokiarchaeota archaeon]
MLEDFDQFMEDAGIDAFVCEGNAFEVSDIVWLTGFRSTDSVTYFKNIHDKGIVATGFKTYDRVQKESFIKEFHDLTPIYKDLIREKKRAYENPDVIYEDILKTHFTGSIIGVPDHLPARVLVAIQQLGYDVKVVPKLLKKARATKSPSEIDIIKKAGKSTTSAIGRIVEMIKDSTIGTNNSLVVDGEPLTVGRVKLALEHYLLDQGAESAEDAIVAVGAKAFDWHYLGKPEDVLKAHVPIIIDVFPRLKYERYVADVTRTIVKGSVSEPVQKMFDAVYDALVSSIDSLSDGAKIDDVNMACFETLKRHGYDSSRLNIDAVDGMTHGLGHGIGLDVHEEPSMYRYEDYFTKGNVMAIEPGVYLKGVGGVRIENDYAVSSSGAERLTVDLEDIIHV